MFMRHGQDRLCQPSEILCFQLQGTDRILPMRVEAGADQHQLRSHPCAQIDQCTFELLVIRLSRRAELHRHIRNPSQPAPGADFV